MGIETPQSEAEGPCRTFGVNICRVRVKPRNRVEFSKKDGVRSQPVSPLLT